MTSDPRKGSTHGETESFLEILLSSNIRPHHELSVGDARTQFDRLVLQELERVNIDFEGITKELTVPSVDTKDGIPIIVYIPTKLPVSPPILVYFHGGGFTMGSCVHVEDTCKILATGAECCVVNVDYRLAPENKFPACYNDAKAVMRWVMMNKSLVGGIHRSIVGVAGDSSGANIAATVCHEVPGISFQILAYPLVDLTCSTESFKTYADGPFLTKEATEKFIEQFLNNENECYNPRASPLFQKSFDGIPPALFIVAEFDPVRDDCHEYGKRIRENGIKSKSLLVRGTIHGFFTLPGHFQKSCQQAYEEVIYFIKAQL
ncbi:unnamed protein product [Acanthosepion pharaonis]|uniref:Alpha/beta hydrolase fold-3 domain-containing protein n=1 Tax=Acanthosepion pharaonis TaxID=158019 RepID=A0A812ELL1_ACAPH|nr:unnamed protein product [Sepia pharaonis]